MLAYFRGRLTNKWGVSFFRGIAVGCVLMGKSLFCHNRTAENFPELRPAIDVEFSVNGLDIVADRIDTNIVVRCYFFVGQVVEQTFDDL